MFSPFYSLLLAENIKSPFNGYELDITEKTDEYSFLIGGHLKGSTVGHGYYSVFPSSSLLGNIDLINSTDARFFISLGDLYQEIDSIQVFNVEKSFTSKLIMPLFNAVGNHDVGRGNRNRSLYESNFGKTYFNFSLGNSSFIFLDTEINIGEIVGDQLEFFYSVLNDVIENTSIKNVFILTHKLIWANDPFFKLEAGFLKYPFAGDSDIYLKHIKPVLTKLSKSKAVFIVSGDHCASWTIPLLYHKDKSTITYIATANADARNDVLLQVKVSKNAEVTFIPVSLSGQKVYPLEYYNFEYWKKEIEKPERSTITKAKIMVKKVLRILRHSYFWIGMVTCGLCLGFLFILFRKLEL